MLLICVFAASLSGCKGKAEPEEPPEEAADYCLSALYAGNIAEVGK